VEEDTIWKGRGNTSYTTDIQSIIKLRWGTLQQNHLDHPAIPSWMQTFISSRRFVL